MIAAEDGWILLAENWPAIVRQRVFAKVTPILLTADVTGLAFAIRAASLAGIARAKVGACRRVRIAGTNPIEVGAQQRWRDRCGGRASTCVAEAIEHSEPVRSTRCGPLEKPPHWIGVGEQVEALSVTVEAYRPDRGVLA